MSKLGSYIATSFNTDGEDHSQDLARAMRVGKIKQMWEDLVEEAILIHTNGVYIVNEDEKKILKVYVDESIYAAELNNRRELILLKCRSRYGEELDAFQIFISRGNMKKRHPFKKEHVEAEDKNPSIPLNEQEMAEIERVCSVIPDESLRYHFKKAMITDLEWKKGNPQ